MMRLASVSMVALAMALFAVPPLEADEVIASAKGEIMIKGQPLAAGKITFYLDDDQFVGAKVKNGSYKITRVPVGVWSVVIEGDGIPAQFASEKASLLKVNVSPSGNIFDFNLSK